MASPVEIFCCYAHKDQQLLTDLKTHLMPLQQQGLIKLWADMDIGAGTEWEKEIEKHLDTAQIILLLISPDFMNSDYCYSKEITRAIERHEQDEARVIPIILRPVFWQGAPFGKLQALPTDAKAVTSRHWHNRDEAFLNITTGIQKAVRDLTASPHPYALYMAWKGNEGDQAIYWAGFDGSKWSAQQNIPDRGTSNAPTFATF